jgi:hypothetical protein
VPITVPGSTEPPSITITLDKIPVAGAADPIEQCFIRKLRRWIEKFGCFSLHSAALLSTKIDETSHYFPFAFSLLFRD